MRRFVSVLARLSFLWLVSLGLALPAEGQNNVLVILLDDIGVDSMPAYELGTDLPTTPFLDGLAAGGIRFDNVWATPVCAPTRAAIQTGRYGFRTGIGYLLGPGTQPLLAEELVIAELLEAADTGYTSAAIGKWHLGLPGNGGYSAPQVAGYDHYSGAPGNVSDYFSYLKAVNGVTFIENDYLTRDTIDDAIDWLEDAPEPWFCHIGMHAAHNPVHEPPAGTYSVDLSQAGSPGNDPRPYFKAVIESLDHELARLFAEAPIDLGDTTVLVVGDNGTGNAVTQPPFDPDHGKFSIYEGGVRVPMFAIGGDVTAPAGSVSDALIHVVDLYSTIAELAGALDFLPEEFAKKPQRSKPFGPQFTLPIDAPVGPLDSVSFVPYLSNPSLSSLRQYVYTERFFPNGKGVPTSYQRAIRNEIYKLIVIDDGPGPPTMELYNLENDFTEQTNLLDFPLGFDELIALAELEQEMKNLLFP